MFSYSKFIFKQLKTFSFIVFVITLALIILNSNDNIIPLNLLTLFGSIILNHYYPNYYKIVNSKDRKLVPLLILADFIIHYLPLILILVIYVVNKKTEINYTLSFVILVLYLLLFHSELIDIYFNYNQYF
jgi:hypothetical protein